MKYYIIKESMAIQLGVISYRKGNSDAGYLVNQSDLVASVDISTLKEVSREEAIEFVNHLNIKI
ncbi:MAG TPA: hypothetical protein DCS83_06865 [Prevotella sp.]|nr:hypothetical protein [Prevotella sp.]